jgi:hypothetical protein
MGVLGNLFGNDRNPLRKTNIQLGAKRHGQRAHGFCGIYEINYNYGSMAAGFKIY